MPAKGFTLIEVLVALGIVAIALMAGLQATGALSNHAQRQVDATAKVWRTRGSLGLPPQLPLFTQGGAYYGAPLV
eukprot:gene22577-42909_t